MRHAQGATRCVGQACALRHGLVVATILFQRTRAGEAPSLEDLDDWSESFGLTFRILRADPEDVTGLFHVGANGIPYFIVLDSEMRIQGPFDGFQAAQLVPLIESALGAR